ncbi:MAG: zf-HC2 domain-containing protein [Planctomycetaceae bacterium]|nr:zf-HC2 domain-containing protein [Planctomycetaceae bacterium]
MQCHEFENRLNYLLDDRQSPEADQQLLAHAANCEQCNQLLIGQRLLLAGLRRGVAHVPGSHLAQRAVAGYQVGAGSEGEPMEALVLSQPLELSQPLGPLPATQRRRVWQVLGWVAAIAAALVITVSIYIASQQGQSNVAEFGPDELAPQTEPPAPQRAVARSDARPGGATGHRPAVRGGLPLFPRTGYGVTIADMATTSIPEAVERIEEVERFAPGIRPIRVSFAVLWNAIWRSIPGLGPEEPDPKAWHGRVDLRPIV